MVFLNLVKVEGTECTGVPACSAFCVLRALLRDLIYPSLTKNKCQAISATVELLHLVKNP
jgi:hypothetical protein